MVHAGTDVFCNPPELLHITLFHTSHPHDPRPCAMDKEESDAIAKLPMSQRRGPTEAEISAELALMPQILGNQPLNNVKVSFLIQIKPESIPGNGSGLQHETEHNLQSGCMRRW